MARGPTSLSPPRPPGTASWPRPRAQGPPWKPLPQRRGHSFGPALTRRGLFPWPRPHASRAPPPDAGPVPSLEDLRPLAPPLRSEGPPLDPPPQTTPPQATPQQRTRPWPRPPQAPPKTRLPAGPSIPEPLRLGRGASSAVPADSLDPWRPGRLLRASPVGAPSAEEAAAAGKWAARSSARRKPREPGGVSSRGPASGGGVLAGCPGVRAAPRGRARAACRWLCGARTAAAQGQPERAPPVGVGAPARDPSTPPPEAARQPEPGPHPHPQVSPAPGGEGGQARHARAAFSSGRWRSGGSRPASWSADAGAARAFVFAPGPVREAGLRIETFCEMKVVPVEERPPPPPPQVFQTVLWRRESEPQCALGPPGPCIVLQSRRRLLTP
ncbi:basic proline-rich protein-like [Cervus elaphus]|uniref:basic proline-rich protein-like n=1 Tax=Cervus canadensis TaxID=1574408 RepID=UPI001C9E5B90|nr:basic proline-rich protein-like [Cervus canadensis]XP_043729595.1 basic proline-rich protein-like [Cervus elaphus]